MGLTRREFSAGLAGAAAGLAAGRLGGAEEGPGKIPPSVVGGLAIGVQSFTFRKFSLERMIGAMRSVGLSSVELWTGHLDPTQHTEADFRTARAQLDAAGIAVSAYCVNFEPDTTPERLERSFQGARLLGTSLLTTSTEKALLPALDAAAQQHGITVGVHNHWLGDAWFKGDRAQHFEGPDDYAQALAGRSPRIAINLDIGHFSAAGHDPLAYFREQHARIVSLHLKDRAADAEHRFTRFGEGATPIAPVLQRARELGFKGAVSIEWELDEDDPTEAVRESFAYVKHALA